MKLIKLLKILLLTGSIILMSGCAAANNQAADVFFDGYDDNDDHVVLKESPQRIVSMNLGSDEILLELVAPERIAALSWLSEDEGLSSIVEQSKAVPVKLADRNPETVIALKPDLVITTGTDMNAVQTLRDVGITVFVSKSPNNMEELFKRISLLGRLTGSEEKAGKLNTALQERLKNIEEHIAMIPPDKRKTVMAFSFNGVIGRSDGMLHEMCRLAGIKNGAAIAGLKKNVPLSKEQIVAVNPDIFFVPTWSSKGSDGAVFAAELRSDPALQTVTAIKNNSLIAVSDRYRYSASQYAVDSVEMLSRTVYPEYFADRNTK